MAEVRKGRLGYEDTLNFVNSLCLTYVLCSAVLRAWIRRGIYGIDDIIVAVATVVSLAHAGSVYAALKHGAGQPWRHIHALGEEDAFGKASLASVITFVQSLYLAKICVVAFLVRVTGHRRDLWIYRACLVVVAVLGLVSLLLVTAGRPMGIVEYWATSSNARACSLQTTRGSVFTAFDITTELILLVLPIYMAWDLQMPLRRKAVVIGAFYLRLPVIGLSAGRFVYTKRLCSDNVDLGLDSAIVLIWQCIESSFALLASQFLAMRAFTLSLNSGFGLGFTVNAGPESYSMQRTVMKSSDNAGSGNGRFWSRRGGSRPSPSAGSQTPAVAPIHSRMAVQLAYVHNDANCRASPLPGHDWPEDRSSSGAATTADDLVIMREQEYTVQYQDNDESPILNRSNQSPRHSGGAAS